MEVATENNPNLHFSHNISKYYYGCIMSGVYLLTWILDLSDKAVVSKLYIYIFKYTHTHIEYADPRKPPKAFTFFVATTSHNVTL